MTSTGDIHRYSVTPETPAALPAMRCLKERCLQTLAYEAGGLLLVTPLYALVFGQSAQDSFLLLAALSVIALLWTPLHNAVFDWVDGIWSGRTASARPHSLRAVHAASLEMSSVIVTSPAVMWIGGYGFWAALAVDIGLTVTYTLYAYVFHLVFDWARPVTGET